MTAPQLLPEHRFEHFYRGGERISALRGGGGGPRLPEEWLASITSRAGAPGLGLSRLADGTVLRDAIVADPRNWLGPSHVDSFGASTELLVKLLDAGQRLPVHVHPDRAFARRHLGLPHGKTEAWVVLAAEPGAQVRLGFTEAMRLAEVRRLVDRQDTAALVGALRSRPVEPGDGILVPAGLPHSIDAGIFVVELQEPTDLSILLEWDGFAVDGLRDGHLGLGFDVALQALRLDPVGDDELETLVHRGGRTLDDRPSSALPAAAAPYFRAHRVVCPPTSRPIEAGFAVLLVTAGNGRLRTRSGEALTLERGSVAVLPWSSGDWQLDGTLQAVVCRPPLAQRAVPAP